MTSPAYSLQALADFVGAELRLQSSVDAESVLVRGLGTLANAGSDQLSFLSNPRYRSQLQTTAAAAVILDQQSAADCPVHCLIHDNPYLAFARLSHYFAADRNQGAGVHSAAIVSDSARLGENVIVAAGAVIMDNVVIGAGSVVGANCVVEPRVTLGTNVELMANVTVYHDVQIGSEVVIHAGAVIGSDGFGYAPRPNGSEDVDADTGETLSGYGWQKIAQLGTVRIGDRVEIGANTTIDRVALDDTVIESDVIIDNQVQIAHNVVVGRGTAIAGCVGIAGSSVIGKFCNIGGGAGIAGHLSIADGTTVMGQTLINRTVRKPGAYASGTGMQEASSWRKSAVRFTQLEALNQRVKALEKALAEATED